MLLLGCSLFGTGRLFDVELELGLGLLPVKRAGHRHSGGRRTGRTRVQNWDLYGRVL